MEHLKIIQLVRLTKRAEDMGHGYHNLKTIGNLIPTYYQAGQAYETRYFYSDFPEEDDSGSLYPYYGILGDRMIFFTSAMDQAVVLFGKAVVEPFYRRFSGKLRHMDVLVNFSGTWYRCSSGLWKMITGLSAGASWNISHALPYGRTRN